MTLSESLSILLKHLGFKVCVCCPGSRNKFLLNSFSKHFKCISVFEERSGGYFCLGINKAANNHTAFVCTTSGTAVAELFPSIIEAYYSQVPYLCVTADLPNEYRVGGYPQAINQVKIFGGYAEFFDVSHRSSSHVLRSRLKRISSLKIPIHLNVSFEETDPEVNWNFEKTVPLQK